MQAGSGQNSWLLETPLCRKVRSFHYIFEGQWLVSPTGAADGYYMLVAAKQKRKVILKEDKMLISTGQRRDPDNLGAAFFNF